jgi:hypothetical protein
MEKVRVVVGVRVNGACAKVAAAGKAQDLGGVRFAKWPPAPAG